MLGGGEHSGLPDLALLDFTVAQDGVDTVVLILELGAESHADGGGDSLSEGTSAHVHAGCHTHARVTLQAGVRFAERRDFLQREEPLERQGAVERRSCMALGEDETVPILPVRILRIHMHFMGVEIGHDIGNGEGPARVAGLGVIGSLYDRHTDFERIFLQLELQFVVHCCPPKVFSCAAVPACAEMSGNSPGVLRKIPYTPRFWGG